MGRYATDAAESAFAELASRFEGELRRGVMMGRRTLTRDGRMIACLDTDGLAIRLGAGTSAFASAMALPGAGPFSPGKSRGGFPDWVYIPTSAAEHWDEFVTRA
jgi:hypothetical protein